MRRVIAMIWQGLRSGWCPAIVIPLTVWGVSSAVLHHFTLVAPIQRFGHFEDDREVHHHGFNRGYRSDLTVLHTSGDGKHAITAHRRVYLHGSRRDWEPQVYHPPLRVWNVERQELVFEAPAEIDAFSDVRLSIDGSWLLVRNWNRVQALNVTNQRKLDFHQPSYVDDILLSHSGHLLFFHKDDTLQCFDLSNEKSYCYTQDAEAAQRLRFDAPLAISPNDRWLAARAYTAAREPKIVVFDVDFREDMAEIAMPLDASEYQLSHDGKALAFSRPIWERAEPWRHVFSRRKALDVLNVATGQTALTLADAEWVGWNPRAGTVIVLRLTEDKLWPQPVRLETWSWRTGELLATYELPERTKFSEFGISRELGNGWASLSPDGRHVLWVAYQGIEKRSSTGPPWAVTWEDSHYAIHLLDTARFQELDQWRIETTWPPRVRPYVAWSLDGSRMIFSDHSSIEVWRVPPNAFADHLGIGLIPAWIAAMIWLAVARWHDRRRATISAPSSIASSETTDAKA